jgi:TonB family protein
MAKDILEKFFEELLSGSGAANSVARERVRDAILAAPQTGDDATLAEIAAHLDEAPDSGGDVAFIAKLASDPDVLREVESAQDFVESIAREEEPVPATLLRLVGAAPAAHRVAVPLRELPARQVSFRRKPVLLWSGAIAAMVVAGWTGYAIRDVVDRGNLPLASVPTGTQEQNAVALLPPPPGDAANNSASPQAYAVVNPPIPISSHAVGPGDYPPESVQFQEQGTVKVKYLVLKNGAVGNCQVEISSGFARLDDAACVLVRQWLFKPATLKDRSAVDSWLDASVVYQLRNPGLAALPQPPATAFAAPPKSQGSVTATRNEALVKAIKDAQVAAAGQRWTEALEKAKEADAIKDDKPAALNPQIHEMIVSYALNAKDYAAAMTQLDKNIATGEGNKLQNLKQALGIAIMAKNKEKTDQYAKELGTNLDNETRLFIATQMMNSGQLKEALDYAMPALQRLSPDQSLDVFRLRRLLGDLKSEADYESMAQEALIDGYPAEAKSVLDEAAAAKLLNGDRSMRLVNMVNGRVTQDATAQTDLQKKAAADPNAGILLGMKYWSGGKYAAAEEAIRSAISRGNLADPDQANMALGHVLLSQGKIQEAITTFRSGQRSSTGRMIAAMWASFSGASQASVGVTAITGPFPPSAPPTPLTSHAVTADDYPPVSIRLQEQGNVGVKYLVREDGSTGDCSVTQSSGKSRLDDAACTMVQRKWKFKPATRNGQPVAEYLTAEIIFQLK